MRSAGLVSVCAYVDERVGLMAMRGPDGALLVARNAEAEAIP